MSEDNILVGYVRKGMDRQLKLSINVSAFEDCETYTTSDGQVYVPLVVPLASLEKILAGELAVTTISQKVNE